MNRLRLLGISLVLPLGLVACATGGNVFENERVFIKTYSGPALPPSGEALLKPLIGVEIKAIDGDGSKAFAALRPGSPNVDADISFKPGVHTIRVGFRRLVWRNGLVQAWSVEDQILRFDAEAGRKYILWAKELEPSKDDPKTLQAANTMKWKAKIEDVSATPERWCLDTYGICKNGLQSPPIPPEKML